MMIDIYPSATKRDTYLGVPQGTNLGSWNPAVTVDADLTQVRPLKKTVDVQSGQSRLGLDPDDVLVQVGQKGWARIQAGIRWTGPNGQV